MNEQAQNLLAKARRVKNHAEAGQLVAKGTRYMTHMEKTAKQEELERVKETLAPNNIAVGSLTQEGRANLNRYKNHLQRDLADNVAPTDISPEARDHLIKAEEALAEQIKQGMLSRETMRRNPPGSVGHHIKWERENKENILAYKNLRRMNYPDDDSEDLANIEMLRPETAQSGQAASFSIDAQIPGHFAMTPAAKANFDEAFPDSPTIDTPLKQIERREFEEMKARLVEMEEQLAQKEPEAAKRKRHRPDTFWSCDQCDENVSMRAKGLHIARHRRDNMASGTT